MKSVRVTSVLLLVVALAVGFLLGGVYRQPVGRYYGFTKEGDVVAILDTSTGALEDASWGYGRAYKFHHTWLQRRAIRRQAAEQKARSKAAQVWLRTPQGQAEYARYKAEERAWIKGMFTTQPAPEPVAVRYPPGLFAAGDRPSFLRRYFGLR